MHVVSSGHNIGCQYDLSFPYQGAMKAGPGYLVFRCSYEYIINTNNKYTLFLSLLYLLRYILTSSSFQKNNIFDVMSMWKHIYRSVSYTHLRAHETRHDLVCRL